MHYDLKTILSQPYTFLGEGVQARAYISADGGFVLKRQKTFEEGKEQFIKWGKQPEELTRDWFEHDSISYQLANDKLREETGLIYFHQAGAESPIKTITLDGQGYVVSETPFLIQEKVELVCDRLKSLDDENRLEKLKTVIDDVIGLISQIWDKGITEDTFNWDHNYGYLRSGELAQIDVGSFWEGEEYIQKAIEKDNLMTLGSAQLLRANYPEVFDYYKERVDSLYKKYKKLS